MTLIYEISLVSENGVNTDIDLVAAATQSGPGGGIDVAIRYDAGYDSNADGTIDMGDIDGDETLDAGETFSIKIDGVFYTATVDFIYDPNSPTDANLMIFHLDDGTGTQYAYNLGIPGETDPAKISGGWISSGHAHNGKLISDNPDAISTAPDPTFCFVAGSMIDTPSGPVAVEKLKAGDAVLTVGNGTQRIRWVGRTMQNAENGLAPIRIQAGALGGNTPSKDLLVSPAHRLVISGWRIELLFGETEALVAAKALVNDDTITVAHDLESFEYFHIMFDRHEIVMSNGVPSESFQPKAELLTKLDHATRKELLMLFPELASRDRGKSAIAMPALTYREASLLH